MPDIFHHFTINAPAQSVFDNISTPTGLDTWWTKEASGKTELNQLYKLHFGPQYDWRAIVSKYVPDKEFELKMTDAHPDWINTTVGFSLFDHNGDTTEVHFYHTGWPQDNDHYRISSYCWAMYLRILKRFLEHGERVLYEDRLDV